MPDTSLLFDPKSDLLAVGRPDRYLAAQVSAQEHTQGFYGASKLGSELLFDVISMG